MIFILKRVELGFASARGQSKKLKIREQNKHFQKSYFFRALFNSCKISDFLIHLTPINNTTNSNTFVFFLHNLLKKGNFKKA